MNGKPRTRQPAATPEKQAQRLCAEYDLGSITLRFVATSATVLASALPRPGSKRVTDRIIDGVRDLGETATLSEVTRLTEEAALEPIAAIIALDFVSAIYALTAELEKRPTRK